MLQHRERGCYSTTGDFARKAINCLICNLGKKKKQSIGLLKSNCICCYCQESGDISQPTPCIWQELHEFSQCNQRIIRWKQRSLALFDKNHNQLRWKQLSVKFPLLHLTPKDFHGGETGTLCASTDTLPVVQHSRAKRQGDKWWDPSLLWGCFSAAVTHCRLFCHWNWRANFNACYSHGKQDLAQPLKPLAPSGSCRWSTAMWKAWE